MNENDEAKVILLNIVRLGLLRIRAFGSSGLAQACSVEADHLHNLPGLVQSFRREDLLYYYNVERPAFQRVATSNLDEFKVLWEKLRNLIGKAEAT